MEDLRNWIPCKLENDAGAWQLRWMDLSAHHIAEPFFDETISIGLARMRERSPYHTLSNTDFLVESSFGINTIAPTCFVFHVSRCGSTLLTQALSTDPGNIVYAEPPLLDEILRASLHDKNLTEMEMESWFKAALKMMGQQRNNQHQMLIIKLDSWHIHFYPLLRKWYPNTPFYFLSRKPDAIIASHDKRRGLHSIPGHIEADLLKVKLHDQHYRDFNFFTAQVLEAYYKEICEIVYANHPLDHFYDYGWGMNNLITHFFAAIGKEIAKGNEMEKRLSFHSKYPDQRYRVEDEVDISAYPDTHLAYQLLIDALSKKHQLL